MEFLCSTFKIEGLGEDRVTEDDTLDEESDTNSKDLLHQGSGFLGSAVVNLVPNENMSFRVEILQPRKQTEMLTMKQQFGILRLVQIETFGF